MYKALESVADPEEEESWESRIARKAFSEFLEKRGVTWRGDKPKSSAQSAEKKNKITEPHGSLGDSVKLSRRKQADVRG